MRLGVKRTVPSSRTNERERKKMRAYVFMDYLPSHKRENQFYGSAVKHRRVTNRYLTASHYKTPVVSYIYSCCACCAYYITQSYYFSSHFNDAV